jgi:hypothetical protein
MSTEDFDAATWALIRSYKNHGIPYPTRYDQRVHQYGAHKAACMTIAAPIADGFTTVAYMHGHPELTIEQLVLDHADLFADDVVAEAKRRLGK